MFMDFKVYDNRCSKESGVTLFKGDRPNRIIIFPHHHESLEDIYKTITHEVIHYCLAKYKHEELDEYEEHDLIFTHQWIDEYIPLD
jgi:hypothetical protein